jgi:hypothetical protein
MMALLDSGILVEWWRRGRSSFEEAEGARGCFRIERSGRRGDYGAELGLLEHVTKLTEGEGEGIVSSRQKAIRNQILELIAVEIFSFQTLDVVL